MRAYTDYPFDFLGDTSWEEAPVREVKVLYYDGNKRCKIIVEGQETEIKTGYLYKKACRFDEACEKDLGIDIQKCKNEYGHYKSSKAAQITKSWLVYPPNYDHNVNQVYEYQNLNKAWRRACALGVGSEVVSYFSKRRRDNSSYSSSGDIVYEVKS